MFPLLLVLVLAAGLAMPSDIQRFVEYPTDCPHGHSVYHVESMILINECVKECYRRQRCDGVRYHRSFQLCELYSNVTFDSDTSIAKGTCLLVRKTSDIAQTEVSVLVFTHLLQPSLYTVFLRVK